MYSKEDIIEILNNSILLRITNLKHFNSVDGIYFINNDLNSNILKTNFSFYNNKFILSSNDSKKDFLFEYNINENISKLSYEINSNNIELIEQNQKLFIKIYNKDNLTLNISDNIISIYYTDYEKTLKLNFDKKSNFEFYLGKKDKIPFTLKIKNKVLNYCYLSKYIRIESNKMDKIITTFLNNENIKLLICEVFTTLDEILPNSVNIIKEYYMYKQLFKKNNCIIDFNKKLIDEIISENMSNNKIKKKTLH